MAALIVAAVASTVAMLAAPLGPDADRVYLIATLGAGARAAVSVEGAYSRHGADNRRFNACLRDWSPSRDNDPPFPTAPVLHDGHVRIGLLHDLKNGSRISGDGGVRFTRGGPRDVDAEEGFGRLEVILDL